MGDGLVIWFVAFSMNGLVFSTPEPFHSEEACHMAAREAGLEAYDCIDVPMQIPDEWLKGGST